MSWRDKDVAALERIGATIADKQRHAALLVDTLRDQGCPWSVIGDALGVTRQAAQQRYGSRSDQSTR